MRRFRLKQALPYIFYSIGIIAFLIMSLMTLHLWRVTKNIQEQAAQVAKAIQTTLPIDQENPIDVLPTDRIFPSAPSANDISPIPSSSPHPSWDAAGTTQTGPSTIAPNPTQERDQRAMPTGRLPADFPTGPRHPTWLGPEFMTPDEFRNIVHLHQENTTQLFNRLGDRRILVSGWTDSVSGTAPPIIRWGNGATCPAETDATNLEAIATLNLRKEVLVSGHINYDFNLQPPIHFMTDCRIHGYYDGGYHHALPLETR